MRWMLVCLGSLACGGLAILLSLASLVLWLIVFGKRYIGLGGWNPMSSPYWEAGVFGTTLLVFGLGCSVGFWLISKRVSRDAGKPHAGRLV